MELFCRPWIGPIPTQVHEAEQRVVGAENFFLQVQTYYELRDHPPNVICHVHGVSPGNRPMGFRSLIIPTEWVYDLAWIEEMMSLWPFAMQEATAVFIQAATPDMNGSAGCDLPLCSGL